jgi:hypothetical protein
MKSIRRTTAAQKSTLQDSLTLSFPKGVLFAPPRVSSGDSQPIQRDVAQFSPHSIAGGALLAIPDQNGPSNRELDLAAQVAVEHGELLTETVIT